MKPQQVSKVWTVVSLALLYYALNSYLVIQGGHEIFGAKLVTQDRVPAALVAVAICSVLLSLASCIGIDFARGGGTRWADRIPLIALEDIDSSQLKAQIYQGFMLFVLSILPAASLMHFWRVLSAAKLATTESPPAEIIGASIWTWSAFTKWDNPASVCTAILGKEPYCQGKMTILPGIEPTVLAIATAFAVEATVMFWIVVFFPQVWPRAIPNRPCRAARLRQHACTPAGCRVPGLDERQNRLE